MNERPHPWIRWYIKGAGGVEGDIREMKDGKLEIQTIVCDSLDDLPENIANAIREDGRLRGAIP